MGEDYEINNNLHDSYVIIKIYEKDMIDYQYRILRKFQIPHILPLASISDQNKHMLYYTVNSMDNIEYCLKEHTFIYPLINQLVTALLLALSELHEHLLEEDRIDLKPEFIFYDRLEKKFSFLYKPLRQSEVPIQRQCLDLFTYLIQNVNSSDYKAISLAHRLRIAIEHERLNMADIKAILDDVSHQEINEYEVLEEDKPEPRAGWFSKRKKSKR